MATLTINTTGAEDARIVVAFGKILRLGRNATQAEVKQWVIAAVRSAVQGQEQADKQAAITGPDAIDPT